jgi:hypothetical protein
VFWLATTVPKVIVSLTPAPHPSATGGGFGFGKFRRDEQGCLVQKFVAAPHRLADGAFAEVEGPNYVIIGSRFRLVFQNVIFHIHVSRLKLWGDATPVSR